MGSKIPKWDCILNFCSNCPIINYPYLQSSEQLDRLFPDYFHKTKFHIFRNISKFLIHLLIPFKYNNTCELCNNIQYKDKRVIVTAKKYFALQEEFIDVFYDKFYISTIKKLSFHISRFSIIGSMEFRKTINDCFHDNASNINIKLNNGCENNSAKQLVYKYKVNIGVEIENYQWKVLLLNIFQFQLIPVITKKILISFI